MCILGKIGYLTIFVDYKFYGCMKNFCVYHGMKIQPWDKVLKSLPPLSERELAELRESIKKRGLKYPIKVKHNG